MEKIREYKCVSFVELMDEINCLIESDRFSHNMGAIEALESVKWWAMEEIIPTVDDAYDVDVRLSEEEMKVIIDALKQSGHDTQKAEMKMHIVEKLLRHIDE